MKVVPKVRVRWRLPVIHGLKAVSIMKSQLRYQEDEFYDLDDNPDIADLLHDCITRLPDHQATCVRKFYFEKLSYADISTHSGMTLDQVRSHIQNGRRNLKKCLESKQKLGSGKNI